MAYTKKRVIQHIMEDRSIRIVRELLPDEWVVREYKPDYGIDLTVELFEFVDEERKIAATLGETLFVQVKSTEVIDERVLRVYGRHNVELGPLQEDPSENMEIEVARLQLETSELLTIQAMGSTVPVLLFLVELSTRRIYFVCLNDLIEKVIIPEDPTYDSKQSKVIYIPLRNRICSESPLSVLTLGTYAKRSKLYAAFEKFAYQKHQLEFLRDAFNTSGSDAARKDAGKKLVTLVRHFLSIVLRYDFWTRMPEWNPIRQLHQELQALGSFLEDPDAHEDLDALREYLGVTLFTWSRLDNLSRVYEEIAKEWFLPTYFAMLLGDDLRGVKAPGSPQA